MLSYLKKQANRKIRRTNNVSGVSYRKITTTYDLLDCKTQQRPNNSKPKRGVAC